MSVHLIHETCLSDIHVCRRTDVLSEHNASYLVISFLASRSCSDVPANGVHVYISFHLLDTHYESLKDGKYIIYLLFSLSNTDKHAGPPVNSKQGS
jgi:hypothetical protein